MEAHLKGASFSPHRHDTYALGVTLFGTQVFRYRGVTWRAFPGQFHLLHPDEVHDGTAGSPDGFGYRIVYVDPSRVQRILAGGSLPFVREPVFDGRPEWQDVFGRLWEAGDQADEPFITSVLADLTELLSRAGSTSGTARARAPEKLHSRALDLARDAIIADLRRRVTAAELEALTGLDRWTLARQFRRAFGTSPSRFRTLRRLEVARRRIESGEKLSDVAFATGFSDQAHLTRHFKRTYGLTPGRWARGCGSTGSVAERRSTSSPS